MKHEAKWIIGLSILSTIFILIGVVAKIQHWVSIKPIMLVGLALQLAVLLYAVISLLKKKQ